MCFLILTDRFARSGTAGIAAQQIVLLWPVRAHFSNCYFLEGSSEQMTEEKYPRSANLSQYSIH